MPAVEVEVDEQESGQGGGDSRLRRRPQGLHAARGKAEQTPHHAEIDQEVSQRRPGESGRSRKHTPPLHHEHDGQEHRRQRGNAKHHTTEQGEGVDVVAVGARLPEVEFRQVLAGQFGDEGDGGTRVERDLVDICFAVAEQFRANTCTGRQGCQPVTTQVRLDNPGTRKPEIRRHQQPLDLLVAIVAQRKQRERGVCPLLVRQHFDAANDAVFARGSGQLDAPVGAGLHLDHLRQIDGVDVHRNGDDFKAGRRNQARQGERKTCGECTEVTH